MIPFFLACSGASFDDQLHSCQLAFEVEQRVRHRGGLMFVIKRNDHIELFSLVDVSVFDSQNL